MASVSTRAEPPLDVRSDVLGSRFRAAASACAWTVVVIGGAALAGWILDDDDLRGGFTGVIIKFNAAVALTASGLALLLLASERATSAARAAGRVLAGFVGMLGIATLTQHLFGWNLGIDQAVFREIEGAAATQSPNRMGPPASICFPLLGTALLLLGTPRRDERAPWQPFAMLVLGIALIPTLGYVFGVRELYGIARFTGISLHTAISFVLLGAGVLLARPRAGLMRQMTASDGGGLLLRRMLPAAIVVPIVLSWLRVLGERAAFYDLEFGRSLLVLSFILVFSALTWWTSMAISRHEAARRRAEAAESEMKERLLEALDRERAAREVAVRSNRMKDEFLATLSHELRTPLQSIVGWAQILSHGGVGDAEVRRGIETIARNARAQARIIEDLLDLSRIVSGTVRLEVGELEMRRVVEAALDAAAPAAALKRLQVERSWPSGPAPVRGDPARLQQVLGNLVANAIKFTPAGGVVAVSLDATESAIEVAVRDTGIGIPAGVIDHVFERFRQADASRTRQHGGLGIGLSIARQLAELHGGAIAASSPGEGLGATFTLTLPRSPAPGADGVAWPGSGGFARTGPLEDAVLDGVRLLVVDDEHDTRELVERVLTRRGGRVTSAASVDAALDALDRERFDVIVSDIGMPERDGYELMRAVGSRPDSIPAIALTAFARPEDRELARAVGYRQHLSKPIDPDHLVAVVADLVGRGSGSTVES